MDSNTLSRLEAEYCPPIDGALFSAIASDHANALDDPESVKELRATLDSLKATALEQEESGFDPSGTGAGNISSHASDASQDAESNGKGAGKTGNMSSLTSGVQSIDLNSNSDFDSNYENLTAEYAQELGKLGQEEKLELLKAAFPDSSESDISNTLSQCHGEIDRAMDELLNHSFITDTYQPEDETHDHEKKQFKGIEAFSEDNVMRRGRKKNRKKKLPKSADDAESRESSLPSDPTSKAPTSWQAGQADIDFISSRVNLPRTKVSTLFYQHGTSIPTMLRFMIKDPSINPLPTTADPVIEAHAYELSEAFPNIHLAHLTALVRLTHPSPDAAYDLAEAMSITQPSPPPTLKITAQPAPLDLTSDLHPEEEWTTITHHKARKTPSPPSARTDASALSKTLALRDARAAAARKSRSNHLMAAASSVYSEQARANALALQSLSFSSAAAHVRAQSTRDTLDLHGVSVAHAVRLARSGAAEWWAGAGRRVKGVDGRVSVQGGKEDAVDVLTIVTGKGLHSQGGRARIGPAVGRMLEREGWKVRGEEGVWVVFGRR